MKSWIEEHLKEGTFRNSSDYVRHLIRKDQERTAAVKLLQQEIDKGVRSGEPKPFDLQAFKSSMKDKYVR
jgi:putative addiction module antidote protein, CC2985 family